MAAPTTTPPSAMIVLGAGGGSTFDNRSEGDPPGRRRDVVTLELQPNRKQRRSTRRAVVTDGRPSSRAVGMVPCPQWQSIAFPSRLVPFHLARSFGFLRPAGTRDRSGATASC